MPKLGRRQSIKIASAALVVGPSVVFTRDAKAAVAGKGSVLRAGYFKVEVDGIYNKIPNVVSVDLGSASVSTDTSKMIHDYLKISLSQDAPKLSKGFAKATKSRSKVAHKISVSLYGKDTKSPAVTYHVLNAVPVSIANKTEGQFLEWKGGSILTDVHKLELYNGKDKLPTNKAFKVEINGHVIAVSSLHKFSSGKGNAIVSTQFNPKRGASKPWLAPRTVKIDGASEKLVVSKGGSRGGDVIPVDSVSLNFGKITLAAAKVHDQLVMAAPLTSSTAPPSSLLGPASSSPRANKATPKLMQVAAAGTRANKATPVLMIQTATGGKKGVVTGEVVVKYGGATTANKSSGGSADIKLDTVPVKMSLASIEFPKLKAGSKAIVTETLRFEVDGDG